MTLHLFLTTHWFDLIESGQKTEEYRKITPYWTKQLFAHQYDTVTFHRAYSSVVVVFQLCEITIGMGDKSLGAPNEEVYILLLGKRVISE